MTATVPDWTREFVTATTENENRETVTRFTGWRAVLDPTNFRRYTTIDEIDLTIVADDAQHGPGLCGTDCHEPGDRSFNLCLMSVPDGTRQEQIDAALTALAEQGFKVTGPWVHGPGDTMTAQLTPVIAGPDCAAPAPAADHPPMRFCRCGQPANRVFTPLDPRTGAPNEAATFYRCNVHAYDADVPQDNVRRRS